MATPDEMYDEANELKDQGDLEAAVAKREEILAMEPGHVLKHSALAVQPNRATERCVAHHRY